MEPSELDILVLYLRKVHAFCFYSGAEYEDERMLAAKCGPQVIRTNRRIDSEEPGNDVSKEYIKKYTSKAESRIKAGP